MTASDRVVEYLGHIRFAIERIDRYVEDIDEVSFLKDELVQDAVIRNLEIIGEACRNILRIDPQFASKHIDFPIAKAIGMRNALALGYFKIEFDVVWRTIQEDLGDLHQRARRIEASLKTMKSEQ